MEVFFRLFFRLKTQKTVVASADRSKHHIPEWPGIICNEGFWMCNTGVAGTCIAVCEISERPRAIFPPTPPVATLWMKSLRSKNESSADTEGANEAKTICSSDNFTVFAFDAFLAIYWMHISFALQNVVATSTFVRPSLRVGFFMADCNNLPRKKNRYWFKHICLLFNSWRWIEFASANRANQLIALLSKRRLCPVWFGFITAYIRFTVNMIFENRELLIWVWIIFRTFWIFQFKILVANRTSANIRAYLMRNVGNVFSMNFGK